MDQFVIDNFFIKFKNLLHSGSDATLTVRSEAGKASVTLYLDLGNVLPPPPADNPCRCREGPSRQRRRLKKAAAREAAAEAAKVSETNNLESEVVAVEISADASEPVEEAYDNNVAVEAKQSDELCDEFCQDTEYIKEELEDENSLVFRFVIKDPAVNHSLEAFENQVKKAFSNMKVELSNQVFITSGYEQLKE